jgi:hypothetical protein
MRPGERFELGRCVATPGVLEVLQKAQEEALMYLYRHVTGQ